MADVTHSRTQSCRRPIASRDARSRGGKGRRRGFSSKLQKERLRIAHGLENPEVDLRD
jgi:hypothetical protein